MAPLITLVFATLAARFAGWLGWDYATGWPAAAAVGLLLPATRVAAAVCLFALMLVMFPANVYAARNPDAPKSMSTPLPRRTAEEIIFLAGAALVAVGSI